MDEDSAVRYWEGYGKIAFDAGQSLNSLDLEISTDKARPTKYIYHNNT